MPVKSDERMQLECGRKAVEAIKNAVEAAETQGLQRTHLFAIGCDILLQFDSAPSC